MSNKNLQKERVRKAADAELKRSRTFMGGAIPSMNNSAIGLLTGLTAIATLGLASFVANLHHGTMRSADWLHPLYVFISILTVLTIIYWGWVRRVIGFGNGAARGGWALAVSFIYLVFALALLASFWE